MTMMEERESGLRPTLACIDKLSLSQDKLLKYFKTNFAQLGLLYLRQYIHSSSWLTFSKSCALGPSNVTM